MPKKCVFCQKRTVGIPTFQVTHKRIEKWATVIPQELKIGDRICQNHFNKDEVGIFSSRNERIKKASLKAGAIPKIIDNNSPNELDDLALPLPPQTSHVKQNILRQYKNKYKQYRNLVDTEIENKTNLENYDQVDNTNSFFEQVASDPNLIQLPSGWSRIVPENNESVIFCKILLKEENFLPYIERSVILNNTSTINCTYLNFFIKPSILSMSLGSNLCTDKLQNIVSKMAYVNMCLGVTIPIELLKFKPKSVFVDNFGKFRHYSCLIINDCDEATQCQFCRTLVSTFSRKRLRSKIKNTEKQIHQTAVSPSKIKKINTRSGYQEIIQIIGT